MEDKIFYITREKLQELKKEHEQLVEFEHKKALSEEMPKIFESEDLNPEFVSFQEDIGFLRSRIDELRHILDNHKLIKNPGKNFKDTVGLGSKVKIDVNGQKDEFTIVGTLEANPALGKISNESPVGKALLGHKIGDEIVVSSPVKTTYKIRNVKYELS
ncbi:MAG: GreA/GreB family elongation factor [Candidatus Staskawiczbacteria bacterium]|jgi:transcription elongation factor GreA